MSLFRFEKIAQSGRARLGKIHTAHGVIETPIFMPVGTAATVKAVAPETLQAIGAQIILANTYHLFLRPGHALIEQLGGLHTFMRWQKPILTDSGGFQVYSLSKMRKISEEGVQFKSHIDGANCLLTPEISTQVQHALDATITMAFDECTEYPATHEVVEKSMQLSMRWAARSRAAFVARTGYAQFGIQQGGAYADLREKSTRALTDIGFEGYAIGGVVPEVKEKAEEMATIDHTIVATAAPLLPEDKPRYLMGIGYPSDILRSVYAGVDMFDCVLPTRNARNGQAFVYGGQGGVLKLRNSTYKNDTQVLDETCTCPTCSGGFSRAYIHHLLEAEEILAHMLISQHNLAFYLNLAKNIRTHIAAGDYEAWMHETLRFVR